MPPKAFDCVDRDGRSEPIIVIGIFLCAVVHSGMAIDRRAKAAIAVQFVGMDHAASLHVGFHEWLERHLALVRDNLRHHVTAALHRADQHCLCSGAAILSAALHAANQGFVDLNMGIRPANRSIAVNIGYMLANEARHAPCCLVGHPKLALQFLGADTVPRDGEQVDCVEPKLQRRAGLRERRSHGGVQVVTAPLARIGPLCLDAKPLGRALA